MQKIKVRKDVAKQVISKLNNAESDNIQDEFAENLQNSDVFSQKKQELSKLQASKNIFSRGNFDEYKFNMGVTPDGQVYDLDNPTEKFYYDLKMKFAENDKTDDIEKGFKSGTPYTYELIEFENDKGTRIERLQKVAIKDIENAVFKGKIKNYWKTRKERQILNDYYKTEFEKHFEDDYKAAQKKNIEELRKYVIDNSKYSNGSFFRNVEKYSYMSKEKNINTFCDKFVKDLGKKAAEFEANKKVLYEKIPGITDAEKKEIVNVLQNNCEKFPFVKFTLSNYKKLFDNPIPTPLGKVKLGVHQSVKFKIYEREYLLKAVDVTLRNPSIIVKTREDNYLFVKQFKDNNGDRFVSSVVIDKGELIDVSNHEKKLNEILNLIREGGIKYKKNARVEKSYLNRTGNINISQQNNLSSKNITKSLTYSGHKLQGRTRLYGMDISIENKKGSYRSGVDKDGHKWRTLMHYDYGYIRGTVGTDSDHLDAYVGPDKNATKVYVIHQNDPVTHKYDEDKCMLCFSSAEDAKKAYMKQYDRPGFYGSMTTMTIEQFKNFIFSHKGKMVHKSFDIQITDITENNKQQKLEQFNKALDAIAENRPFMIKHIPADNSQHYENLTVRLMDFDKSKIEKAVHKVALSLDSDVKATSKGESFIYKAQEELTEKLFKDVTDRARAIYNFVISYFDLPDIRIVSKAGELRHKGKILYNPETGLPIKESEWKKFVVELEKFLNRNYTGIGEKIVLSAESLGMILDRLSKTNSFEAIRKMSLSEMKAKRYDVDWISESVKNMKDTFGDVISRERQARIQIAVDSAAQRVSKVSDDIKNNIQQIIIDGIRDKQSKSVVAQNLFDKCASLNRDMQRIADSEFQMATNSAYVKDEVYSSKPGEKVYFKRFEVLDDNTCPKCRKLNGTIAIWSDVPLPDERIQDPYAKYAIWDGKNDGECPIALVHPWCRGSWVRYYPEI